MFYETRELFSRKKSQYVRGKSFHLDLPDAGVKSEFTSNPRGGIKKEEKGGRSVKWNKIYLTKAAIAIPRLGTQGDRQARFNGKTRAKGALFARAYGFARTEVRLNFNDR